MIRVQRLFGPEAGLQTTHERRLTFGRLAGNDLVLDHPNLSRQHGELVERSGQWYLINHSPNGTSVSGKKITHDKPHALRPGDVIGIGRQKLLAVHFQPPAAAGDAEQAAAPARKSEMSRRAKLWLGIGIYMFVIVVVAAVLWGLGGDGGAGRKSVVPLTDAQIEAEIRKPLERTPDEREANRMLAEARQWYPRSAGHEAGLYHTHRNYKLALAFAGRTSFEGIDQLQFNDVERELVSKITQSYREAYARLRSRDWISAERILRELLKTYPDSESRIWQNVTDQLQIVMSARPKGRSFR
jgi:hypothetical protein